MSKIAKNRIATSFVLLAGLCLSQFGCAMCCSVDDYTYSTFGGKWQRSNPTYGRVGSIFSDPGTTVEHGTIDETSEPPIPGPDQNADPVSFQ